VLTQIAALICGNAIALRLGPHSPTNAEASLNVCVGPTANIQAGPLVLVRIYRDRQRYREPAGVAFGAVLDVELAEVFDRDLCRAGRRRRDGRSRRARDVGRRRDNFIVCREGF
jgi:hypothetical protein